MSKSNPTPTSESTHTPPAPSHDAPAPGASPGRFKGDDVLAARARVALVDAWLYPAVDLAAPADPLKARARETQEARDRAGLPILIGRLNRSDLRAVTALVRLLLVEPPDTQLWEYAEASQALAVVVAKIGARRDRRPQWRKRAAAGRAPCGIKAKAHARTWAFKCKSGRQSTRPALAFLL